MDGPAPATLALSPGAELVVEIEKRNRPGGVVRRDGICFAPFRHTAFIGSATVESATSMLPRMALEYGQI